MEGNLVRSFKNEDSFSNMCRVCLAWNGDSMPSIFDSIKSDRSVPIIEVINNLTNISIKEGDGLPERICDTCLIATERILEFKQLCEQTDSNLRKFLLSLNGKNGAKTSNCEVEKEDLLSNNGENSVYSSISGRIRVESEVMIVDPSCSIYDENQNQPDLLCEEQTINQQNEEEWSGGDPPSASGHTVFDWETGDQASEFVSSSYDAVESFTYDKLAAASENYMPVQTVDSGSDDEVQLKTFKCRTCHKAFHTQKWLERHSQLHDEVSIHYENGMRNCKMIWVVVMKNDVAVQTVS
ncbi:hypothetical protein LSTR_LSTR011873 [Laodelphax striatellus]|uniref:Uncharacterized protein n=1 Tax=Laodelphax striatellus TaxID=195883 RepID=A0A482XJ90_LAOST|nr:hypothetical protein LSTR_LSTR011873 [Laodelphax striatellus]